MAKITTITNPLTGQPAQVDQLDHTAQQIDDGLNIARGVSNPNLLDNWYFGNPINQRGQTSYTGAGYGIDRWVVSQGTGASITLNSDGTITFTAGSNTARFSQRLGYLYPGEYCASVFVTDLTGGTMRLCVQEYGTTYATVANTWGVREPGIITALGNANNLTHPETVQFFIEIPTGVSVTLKAAKLELGDQQTLAHQDENGNWVLNEIPDYGEQLARCQRYFYRWPYLVQYLTLAANGGYGMADFQFPVTMRTIPTITNIKGTNTDLSTFNFAAAQGGVHFQNTGTNMVSITNFDAVADL